MKALILAAGHGMRHRANGDSKPLIPVLGLSLIERAILTARKSGITKFCIVTGYNGDKIRNRLADGKKYGVEIEYVQNDEWDRGNGISTLKAQNYFRQPFILLMSDHIYDCRILESLLTTNVGEDECILCVDRNFPPHLNLDDATKVLAEDNRIKEIGKKIKNYNGIDTGIFLCNPIIFAALEESSGKGDYSLSGGIRILAQRNNMRCKIIEGNFWIDVDDDKDLKNAERLLCKNLKKETDGPVSKIINRPISLRISKILLKAGITPNQVSLLSFIIGISGASLFFLGEYFYLILGGILVQIHSIMDGCDGEVARLKLRETKYGAWFDAVLDRYADAAIILGLTYGYWSISNDGFIWIIGFVAVIGSFLNSYTGDKYDSIFRNEDRANRSKIRIGRDVRLLLITIGALTNQIPILLVIVAALANFEALRRLIVFRNKLENNTLSTEKISN
ncbi:MAG: sugar phosphate nucleotidyltransferase [Nitrososphaerales archaeon]